MTSEIERPVSSDGIGLGEVDDDFLLREGLDLLADFRSISSGQVRDQIRAMIKVIADTQLAGD